MSVTSHRLPNGQHQLRNEAGEPIGRAWRLVDGPGFRFSLNGIYWHKDVPNTRGGSPSMKAKTLSECRAVASAVLSPQGYGLNVAPEAKR